MRRCSAGGRSLVTFTGVIFSHVIFFCICLIGNAGLRRNRIAHLATRPVDALHG